MSLNRRNFLKGALATGGLVAISSLAACGNQATASTSSDSNASWDAETDVVIVGSGSGLYTALKLHDDGNEVLVLEKGSVSGGSTAFSTSVVWAPANKVMLENGYADTLEEGLKYIKAGSGETFVPELAEAFINNANPALEEVTRLANCEWALWNSGIDYRPELEGGKMMGRALVPVVEEGKKTAGQLSIRLADACAEKGIEIRLETPATELVVRKSDDGTFEILGVVAEQDGKQIRIKARKAVVMAAGGFDWNEDMQVDYLRIPARYSWGVATDDGSGIRMGMAIGSDLRFMAECWLSSGYKKLYEQAKVNRSALNASATGDGMKPGVIFINKHGKRFVNEGSNYDSCGRVWSSQESAREPRGFTHLPAYIVCDATAAKNYALGHGEKGAPGEPYTSYATLEEMAVALSIPVDALIETISTFNAHAAEGKDPEFGRGEDIYSIEVPWNDTTREGAFRTLAPLIEAPFYAAELVPVMLGTYGGIRVDANANALHVNGSQLGRLYAQGNCAGVGVGGAFYTGGGGTIGPALAFGHIAANSIAELQAWE